MSIVLLCSGRCTKIHTHTHPVAHWIGAVDKRARIVGGCFVINRSQKIVECYRAYFDLVTHFELIQIILDRFPLLALILITNHIMSVFLYLDSDIDVYSRV